MPLFSIIIPTYNRAVLLSEALRSVVSQRFTDYEIVVVDDGSTDNTLAMLQEFGSGVRVFSQQNRGPGSARNLGCDHAQGRYLAFLDSDDVWFPWTLAVYAEVIRTSNQSAFIAGKPSCFTGSRDLAAVNEMPILTRSFADYYSSGDEWRWWGVTSFVIRSDALRAVGGFADGLVNGEDADLAMRLGQARGFIQICSPFTFGYREHPGSVTKQFPRTIAGGWNKIRAEQSGEYPGGICRAQERWRILTRHLRPISLECLQLGVTREGWRIYCATFRWNFSLRRWKYLTIFPLLTIWHAMRITKRTQRI